MIKFHSLIFLLSLCIVSATAQKRTYKDSIIAYQRNYVNTHEVVLKNDRKYLNFYPADKSYRVTASFKRIFDTTGFEMNTSSGMMKKYFIYGLLTFKLHDSLVNLYVYQSAALMKQEKLKDYLFVPFGDATSGFESYGGGRYMEFFIKDLKNNKVILDFNKAYNPYCAYTTGFNCPLPPAENLLRVAIPVGEMNYSKPTH